MCEVLIRVLDKVNPNDPYLDCKLFKRGDIVTIQDDGWVWTPEEKSNPDWRIIKFTAIPLAQAISYLDPQLDVDKANPSRMLRRRKFSFDIDNLTLPAAFRTWLADGTRAAPTRSIGLTGAQLIGYMKTNTVPQDPNILG